MRELVLNHASLRAANSRAAVGFLKDVATGIAQLVHDGVAGHALRAAHEMAVISCAPGYSLWDALQALQRTGARDQYVFLMRTVTKAPLMTGVPAGVEDRFLACEARGYSPDDGAPLLYCALFGGIAVGFPTAPEWDRDRLVIEFDRLEEDTVSGESEAIDHLARAGHAAPISERHRQKLRLHPTAEEAWANRHTAFPNLVFGSDVEDRLERNLLNTIIGKLAALDDAAGGWRDEGGTMPSWTCKVTNESQQVWNAPNLRQKRMFRSRSGEQALFMWHARYGSGGRIHLRFDAERLEVEIGYIGPHLPL